MTKWFVLLGGIFFVSIALLSIGLLKQSELHVKEQDQEMQEPVVQPEEFPMQNIFNTEQKQQEKSVLAWIPYWDQERAVASFKEHVEQIDYVSFFWYHLDAHGEIKLYQTAKEDTSAIEFAHAKGVHVFAIVANLPDYPEGGDWDSERVDEVISTAEGRKKHIADLLRLVEKHSFDGINIDYEALQKNQKQDFTDFIEELARELHKKDKLLAVALHPKTSEGNRTEDNGSAAQDWQALAQHADQLHFMTYEEHYERSGPGPVASIGWVEQVVAYARNTLRIPAEKVFLGVPLYGYDWQERRREGFMQGKGLEYEQVQQIISTFGAIPKFDTSSQSPFVTYKKDGRSHTVWFENAQSTKAKLELADAYGVSNIALWRLGREDPDVWNVIDSFRD